jgi:molecular chaperone DnaJ
MSHRDPYETLDVSRDADQDTIKSAYRRLALEYHPDKNPDDESAEEAFQQVCWAYEILSDPVRRRRYDRGGLGATDGPQPGEFSLRQGVEAFAKLFDQFGELFADATSEAGPGAVDGQDLYATLDLTLEEAMSGGAKEVTVPEVKTCPACRGCGAAPGADIRECPDCEGRGQQRPGLFSMLECCKNCHGSGDIASEDCPRCEGSGRVRGQHLIEIDVPAGVRDGQTLRRAGGGAPGRGGGKDGDLKIDVRLQPHPSFDRRGNDVHAERAIPSTKASLGGDARVPTLEGDVRMTIPAGTTSGDVFRLQGRGFPDVRTGVRGDQFVEVVVETPIDMTERQRDRARRNATEDDESSRAREFGEKILDLFSGSA